jgi:hypothetical protein
MLSPFHLRSQTASFGSRRSLVVHCFSIYEVLSASITASNGSTFKHGKPVHTKRRGRTPTDLASNKSKGKEAVRMAHWCRRMGIVGVCNLHAHYAHLWPEDAPTLHKAEIIGTAILSLLVWLVAGYFFGLSMWRTLDNKYR